MTVADTAAQAYLTTEFTKLIPAAKILGEESFSVDERWQDSPLLHEKGDVFVIDPIDGTRRFARGDDYGIMVALRQGGVVQAAWIYYPVDDTMLFASLQDKTVLIAWRGDAEPTITPVTIPPCTAAQMELREYSSLRPVAGDLGPYEALRGMFASVVRSECIATEMRTMLMQGKSAHCTEYNSPWDRAPIAFIAEQAGAPPVLDFTGSPASDFSTNFILAPNKEVQQMILDVARCANN